MSEENENKAANDDGVVSVTPIWDGPEVQGLSVGDTLWDFDLLKIPSIWAKYGVKGEKVNVYVIDSGCSPDHFAFGHSSIKAMSFINGNDNPKDGNGHGTWCCGKIGAQGVGLAPNCRITSLRTLDDRGSGYTHYTTNALKWIANQPDPHIVNMSLGSTHYSAEQAKICKELYARGVLLVAAAGNENTIQDSYPAAYDGVLAVAAIDKYEDRAWFSNYGDHVAVAAPGVSCYSTYLNKTYRKLQGTSMASPTVAGLLTLGASLLLKKNPSIGRAVMRDLLRETLQETAMDLGQPGKDLYYGWGGIQGGKFMQKLDAKT